MGESAKQKVVTFDGAPPPGTINLGIGQPSPDLLPVDLVGKASELFFADADPLELNYGVVRGDRAFLESLAGLLTEGYGAPASVDELCVTGGNSQAMDLISAIFAEPGDTVFVEEPIATEGLCEDDIAKLRDRVQEIISARVDAYFAARAGGSSS